MAADDLVERALQEGDVERPTKPEAHCDIPCGIAGVQAVKIPKRLLGDGRGKAIKRFAWSTDAIFCGKNCVVLSIHVQLTEGLELADIFRGGRGILAPRFLTASFR